MPCRDYYDDHPEAYYGPKLKDQEAEIAKLKKQISFAESALCATLDALALADCNLTDYEGGDRSTIDFYAWINFGDAGIDRESVVKWHKRHKEIDAEHRAMEQERLKKVRSEALKKLSDEEKKVLGIQ